MLLVPLSAVAAAAVISNGDDGGSGDTAEVALVAEVPGTAVTTTEAETLETVFVTDAPAVTRADLEAACGEQGWELVEREAEGTINELEQAALDSLRQICAEEGFELPGPPAPPPVIRTVEVADRSQDATTTTTMGDDPDLSDRDHDDDDHDDEDDDDDDEDDDHDDHDDEDDDHDDEDDD
jgi:hypothetical protein